MAGFELFGFEISKKDKSKKTFVTPENDDGATTVIEGGGIYGHYLETGVDSKDENVLIKKYREMAMSQEIDLAISDIVNEAIVHESGKTSVSVSLENVGQSDGIKTKIANEFKTILKLLDFNKTGADLFRKWYVDGKLYHHIVAEKEKLKEGIQELIPIDALTIQKIKEIKREKDLVTNVDMVIDTEEYFVYTPTASGTTFCKYASIRISSCCT